MNRCGRISLETVLNIIFLFIITLAVISAISYFSAKIDTSVSEQSIVPKYTKLLIELREDALMASKAIINQNSFTLIDRYDKEICTYKNENGILIKKFPNPEIPSKELLTNIKTAQFWLNAQLQNLLSVKIITNNEKDIPFFTSFSLRCYKNE